MNGLLTFLPISITFYIGYWLLALIERSFGLPFRRYFGMGPDSGYYLYAFGIIGLIILLTIMGFCLEFYLGRLFLSWGEQIMAKIPIVKTVYSSLKEVITFFKPKTEHESNNYMVIVTLTDAIKVLGYVTCEGAALIEHDVVGEQEVVVILPFCYQMGGNTLIVPTKIVQRLDISVEEGMKLALTGFVVSNSSKSAIPRLTAALQANARESGRQQSL